MQRVQLLATCVQHSKCVDLTVLHLHTTRSSLHAYIAHSLSLSVGKVLHVTNVQPYYQVKMLKRVSPVSSL